MHFTSGNFQISVGSLLQGLFFSINSISGLMLFPHDLMIWLQMICEKFKLYETGNEMGFTHQLRNNSACICASSVIDCVVLVHLDLLV